MRDSNYSISTTETVTKRISKETITSYAVKPNAVIVTVDYYDDEGLIIYVDTFTICGGDYELLMSEHPTFAPGKPAREFRRDDLWYFIDKQRGL